MKKKGSKSFFHLLLFNQFIKCDYAIMFSRSLSAIAQPVSYFTLIRLNGKAHNRHALKRDFVERNAKVARVPGPTRLRAQGDGVERYTVIALTRHCHFYHAPT